MKNFFLSLAIICNFLVASLCLSALPLTHAQASGANIECPDGVYKGKVEFNFIKRDLGPVTTVVDNMLFFYGGEPKDLPQNPNSLHLKDIMICSDGGEQINTATKHIGSYIFLNKKCNITLVGKGNLQGANLTEQGDATLICKDKSAFQGDYSITATNLLALGGNQGNGPDAQGAETKKITNRLHQARDGMTWPPNQNPKRMKQVKHRITSSIQRYHNAIIR